MDFLILGMIFASLYRWKIPFATFGFLVWLKWEMVDEGRGMEMDWIEVAEKSIKQTLKHL